MVRIVAVIRPHLLEQVKSALAAQGVAGLTVADVRVSTRSDQNAKSLFVPMPIRCRIEIVAPADEAPAIEQTILENGRTNEDGDGFIAQLPVQDALRIRTGERGAEAL